MHSRLLTTALIAMLSQHGARVVRDDEVPPPFPDRPPPLPPMLTSQRNDPRHWNVEPDFGASHLPMAGADAERYAAAQAKRDRKAAKRLRDAKGGGDA